MKIKNISELELNVPHLVYCTDGRGRCDLVRGDRVEVMRRYNADGLLNKRTGEWSDFNYVGECTFIKDETGIKEETWKLREEIERLSEEIERLEAAK